MGDVLHVTPTLLEGIGTQIEQVAKALDDAGKDEAARGWLGPGQVSEKFHDFSDNWKVHRGKLATGLHSFAQIATAAGQSFGQTDAKAAQITPTAQTTPAQHVKVKK